MKKRCCIPISANSPKLAEIGIVAGCDTLLLSVDKAARSSFLTIFISPALLYCTDFKNNFSSCGQIAVTPVPNLKAHVVRILRSIFGLACCGCLISSANAQWLTQTNVIKPGWTAIYLHVDASYQSLDQLVGADPSSPIVEIWRWQAPATTVQFITSTQSPLTTSSDWAHWARNGSGALPTLSSLTPNSAYLVHNSSSTNYTWRLKGKPVAPNYTWTVTGLNFIGFPTPSSGALPFDTFLSPVPAFGGAAEVYYYPGGDLSDSNPTLVFAPHTVRVTRGQAFWIRSGTVANDYFGPFTVSIAGSGGINFGTIGSQYSFHLKNTSATNTTVTLKLLSSETPPLGQPSIAGAPPILVRGSLNTSNLTYNYAPLSVNNGQVTWALPAKGQPGSDITVILGVNRSALLGSQGTFYGGVLRFTDPLGYEQVDVPISAQSASVAGLWVGKAMVSQVAAYLKSYQRDQNGQPVVTANGNYNVTNIDTSLGSVAQAFPLRLIMHNDGTNVVLLQRVFYGQDAYSNIVVSTSQNALDPAHLDSARRITSVTLPRNDVNTPWGFSGGTLAPGNTLTAQVVENYDDQASNPFLHTYHPDHDNLDATFQNKLPRGAESYDIERDISLAFAPVNNDFDSLTRMGQSFSGTYAETITLRAAGSASRHFNVAGIFSINRISPVATLTQQ